MEVITPPLKEQKEIKRLKASEKERYIRQQLRKIVNLNPHGVTLVQLNNTLSFDYRTIEKHLFALQFTNEVYTQKIGATTLYLSNLAGMKDETKRNITIDDHEFEVSEIENREGEFVLIRQLREGDTRGGVLVPKDKHKEFLEFLV
ncbi:MAG: hypothetical protein V3U19_02255 [Thermodesulfobacteriota bacterium]